MSEIVGEKDVLFWQLINVFQKEQIRKGGNLKLCFHIVFHHIDCCFGFEQCYLFLAHTLCTRNTIYEE